MTVAVEALGVKLGDGKRKAIAGLCKEVSVDLGPLEIVIDLFVFDMGEVDVILGIDWLASIGEVLVDWRKQIMKFDSGGRLIELRGLNASGSCSRSLFKIPMCSRGN